MSDEQTLDAESVTRNRKYDAKDHLAHLLKIGYKANSAIIKTFVQEHQLEDYLREIVTGKIE